MPLKTTSYNPKPDMHTISFKVYVSFEILFALLFFSNCGPKRQNYEPAYSNTSTQKNLLFGVPTQSYYEICDLFVKYFNDRLDGPEIQTVGESNFLEYIE